VSGPDSEASVWVGRGPDPNVPAVVRGSGAPVGTRSPSMEAGIGKVTTTATGMGTHPLRNCAPGMEAGGEQRMSNGSRRHAERVASGAKAGASEELNRKISLKRSASTYSMVRLRGATKTPSASWLMDPRTTYMRRWDILAVYLLAFTAVVTPFEVAFLSPNWKSALFWVNRLVDILFIIDLVMNFNLIYLDEASNTFITNRWKISGRYVRGFFLIDLLSVMPFDSIGMLLGGGDEKQIKILRIIRLLRLLKLLRIIRSGRIFRRLENALSINYSVLQLSKFVLSTILVSHWLACGYHMVTLIEGEEYKCIGGIEGPIDPTRTVDMDCSWITQYFGTGDIDWRDRYVAALYWSTMTISTVGYGDIVPATQAERCYLIFAMLIGASVYAYVVGSVCGIVTSMDLKQTEYFNLMDNLNAFIRDARLSGDVAHRLRNYFRYRRGEVDAKEWHTMLNLLSPSLREEVAMQLNAEWMEKVPFFKCCPSMMLIRLSFVLKNESYPPDETFILADQPATKLCLIKKGIAVSKGRIFTAGMTLGDEMLMDRDIISGHSARSMTYTDLVVLSREDLFTIIASFPSEGRRLRSKATRRIVRDHILAYSKAFKEIKAQQAQLQVQKSYWSTSVFGQVDGYFNSLSYGNQMGVMMKADAALAKTLEKSALRMQAALRGMLARKAVERMKVEKAQNDIEGAATVAARRTKEILEILVALAARVKNIEAIVEQGAERPSHNH